MRKNVLFMLCSLLLLGTLSAQENGLEPHEIDARTRVQTTDTDQQTVSTTNTTTKVKNPSGMKDEATLKNEKSALPGYELDVDGEGAFRLPGLGGVDLFDETGTQLGWLRHGGSDGDDMYLTNGGTGNLHLYTSTGEVRLFSASNQALTADANQNIGIGTPLPSNRLHVEGDAASTDNVVNILTTYAGNSDVRGVYTSSVTAPGWGYGGEFRGGYTGVYGVAEGTTYTGSVYGVRGSATSSSDGTSYGVYGSASTGTGGRAYGVYAVGDLKVSSQIFVGTSFAQEDAAAGFELVVDGEALVEEVKVELSGSWPDYVFEESYELMPLHEVETFIAENGHLPNIPSATQVEDEGGFLVGDVQKRLLEKVEELTLYMIELKKENDALKQENAEIKNLLNELKNK